MAQFAGAGSALAAIGSAVGGLSANRAGKANQAAANQAAVDEEQDGADTEARIREAARLSIGEQIAAQGSNGFQIGSGSALDALTQSQVNATVDALAARRRSAAAARSLRVRGELARREGKAALVSGAFGAAAGVIQARSDWASARSGQSGGARTGGPSAELAASGRRMGPI